MSVITDGKTVAQMDNDEKGELTRIALQGLVSVIAAELLTPENLAKITILAKIVETGSPEATEALKRVHIEKLCHSLTVLTCLEIVIPISRMQLPPIIEKMEFIEIDSGECVPLPANLEGN